MIDTDKIEPTGGDIAAANITEEVLRVVADQHDESAPRALLDAARNPASPLHNLFEWDDSIAAERYRLAQAGALFRRVRLHVVRVDADTRQIHVTTVRATTSNPDKREKNDSRSYGRTTVVMRDKEARASVLHGIVQELLALREKHRMYSELHDVWVAIDDAVDMFEPPKARRQTAGIDKAAPPPEA